MPEEDEHPVPVARESRRRNGSEIAAVSVAHRHQMATSELLVRVRDLVGGGYLGRDLDRGGWGG